MVVQGVFKSDLRVTSKATALEFYKGVKNTILIPFDKNERLRVEPNRHISIVSSADARDGTASFIPAFYDEDGTLAYRNRKYINAYLSSLSNA